MRRAALLAVALATLSAPPARAQSADELASLKQEQARLRQSLDEIDRRIRAIEGAGASDTPAAPPSTPSLLVLQRNWLEIKPGITKARVDGLLGKPEREMRINGDLVWYYVYPGIGRGSVFFNGEDKVTAAQAPRSSWSW
jgi:hypothetical protein